MNAPTLTSLLLAVSRTESAISWHLQSHRGCGDNGPCKAYDEYEADAAEAERALVEFQRSAVMAASA